MGTQNPLVLVLLDDHAALAFLFCASTTAPVPLLISLQSFIFAVRSFISLLPILIDAGFELSASSLLPLARMVVLFLDLLFQSSVHIGLQSKVGVVELFFLDLVGGDRVLFHLLYGPLEGFFSARFLLGGCVRHHVLLYQLVPPGCLLVLDSLIELFSLLVWAFITCILNSKDLLFLKPLHIVLILLLHLLIFSLLALLIIFILSFPFHHQLIKLSRYLFLSCIRYFIYFVVRFVPHYSSVEG